MRGVRACCLCRDGKGSEGRKEQKSTLFGSELRCEADPGITVGSAIKTASIHNVDNRIMFSAGVAALQLGILKGCSVAYGIPLKASGKNIIRDMKFSEH